MEKQQYNVNNGLRVFTKSNEAYNVAVKCLLGLKKKKVNVYPLQRPYKLPPEVNSNIWEVSIEALENTLSYIFDYLQYVCYMVCVCDGKVDMYKLSGNTTGKSFIPFIDKSISMVSNNPKITKSQREYITQKLSNNPLRLMQCIVKEYQNESKYTKKNEYLELLKGLPLHDGIYIFNLSDAVILRKDFKHPFPMVTGPLHLESKYKSYKFLPIFSISGQKGYHDIPIPNYDDVLYVLGHSPNVKLDEFNTDWSTKIPKAVFRGSPTGCGYTEETNMRLKIATIESQYLDAKISGKGDTINTLSIRYDPKYGLGMLNTNIKPSKQFMTMMEQSNHKYIVHIDGNVNAYRLLTTMATGSLILRVESEYTSWVDHLLEPYIHYVPVNADLSNLLNRIHFCMINDKKSEEIAKNGMIFSRKMLEKKNIQSIIQNIMCHDYGYNYITKEEVKQKELFYRYVTPQLTPPSLRPNTPEGPPPEDVERPERIEKVKTKKIVSKESLKKTVKKRGSPPKKVSPPIVKKVAAVPQAEDIIDFPAGKTRCPNGYKGVIINGVKKCKKIRIEVNEEAKKEQELKRVPSPKRKSPPKQVKEPVAKIEPEIEEEVEEEYEDIIDFPVGKTRCPNGYKSVTINGVKKCKGDIKTRKVKHTIAAPVQRILEIKPPQVETAKPITIINPPVTNVIDDTIIDFPVGKTRCPNGYKSVTINGVKKCKKNA
jgi:DNA-binding phage protein